MFDFNASRLMLGDKRVLKIKHKDITVYRPKQTFTVRAKPYPSDGQVPFATLEDTEGQIAGRFNRDWIILVWNKREGMWRTDVDYKGPLLVDTTHPVPVPRYDTYNVNVRATQQAAFCAAIDALPIGTAIVIVANHAPENYNAAMVQRIKHCGGTDAKLSWTTRSSYILVGEVGVGTGNAHHEVLNNKTFGSYSNCAEITFSW